MAAKKIFIVEDDDSVRMFLEDFLTDRGFDVAIAASGEEALERMAHVNPDIVLLDVNMPGMDGITCLSEIKKKHPKIEVIMITAQTEATVIEKAKKLGARDYITKPFSLDYLETELLSLMEGKKR